jgi:hypothetical protein
MSLASSIENLVDTRVKVFIEKLLQSSSLDAEKAFALWKELSSKTVDASPSAVDKSSTKAPACDGRCQYVFTRAPLSGERCSVIAKSGPFCGKHKPQTGKDVPKASSEAIGKEVVKDVPKASSEVGAKKSILQSVNKALAKSPRKHSRDSDDEEEDKKIQAKPDAKRIDSDEDHVSKRKREAPVVIDLDEILDELQEDDDNSFE